ncbi:DUF1932 domain-containing protein [Streptomyces sp. BH055]|uniref:DUF1932 domain-containing protein n=1 Tax=Streptomyces sp. BH055 TaxID=3401173 RepID=UPI003BB6D125
MKIGIVGCGEVGLSYAEKALELNPAAHLLLLDPAPGAPAKAFADSQGLPLHRAAGPWLGEAELVLLATPGGALRTVLDPLTPQLPAGTVIADLSTASADAKRDAAAHCAQRPVRYVDIAITGSVAVTRAATPLLYAGAEIPELLALFQAFGAPVTVLEDSRPGDAMRVKLLRSVLMKGLEALAVECLPAARTYGVLDQLWAALQDVDRTGFTNLLQAMTRTHPRHAARREHEVAQAAEQLERIGYPSAMTRATEQRFAATREATAASAPADDTTDAALDWITATRRDTR